MGLAFALHTSNCNHWTQDLIRAIQTAKHVNHNVSIRSGIGILAACVPTAIAAPGLSEGASRNSQILMQPSPSWPPEAISRRPTSTAASTDNTVLQWPSPGASAVGRPRKMPTICKRDGRGF